MAANSGRRATRASEFGSDGFEPDQHLDGRVHLRQRQRHHLRPPIGDDAHQPFRLQDLEGLSQRRPGDTETLGEHALGDAPARRQVASNDHVTDALRDEAGAPAARAGQRGGRIGLDKIDFF